MNTNSINPLLNNYADTLLTWGVAAVLLLLGAALAWTSLRNSYAEFSLRRKIRNVAVDVLHQVVVTDGLDGAVFVDNLLLTPQGILVLPVHRYRGALFAADNIDNWTQVVGKRSYKFANPLRQLEADVIAIKTHVPDVPVEGRVLYTKGVEFPKGKPEQLVSVKDLMQLKATGVTHGIPNHYLQAWDNLRQLVRSPEMLQLRKTYAVEETTQFSAQSGIGLLLLVTAGLWIIWRLVG